MIPINAWSGTSRDAGAMKTRTITPEDVIQVIGRIEDERIVAIVATGGTLEDLEEAAMYAEQEDDVMGELRKPLTGVAADIYDILTRDQYLEEDEHTPLNG